MIVGGLTKQVSTIKVTFTRLSTISMVSFKCGLVMFKPSELFHVPTFIIVSSFSSMMSKPKSVLNPLLSNLILPVKPSYSN